MDPTLVIISFNRIKSLKRLLSSLNQAKYPNKNINLVISIDNDGKNKKLYDFAIKFNWEFGSKEIIYQDNHLGLVKHVMSCGDLVNQYESIILLEDDLYVSPVFYLFASQCLAFYENDPKIAGISLYTINRNGFTKQPFNPLTDNNDTFFLQIPYSQGQVYSKKQWNHYRDWYYSYFPLEITSNDNIHEMFLNFDSTTEWFHLKTKYLVDHNKFYVYPRESITTSFGDIGTHFKKRTNYFQVPIQRIKQNYNFTSFDHSLIAYDSFFEILPSKLNKMLKDKFPYPYSVDLYGTKSLRNITEKFVLTSKKCKKSLFSFGKLMKPMEANIIDLVEGKEIVYCKKDQLKLNKISKWENEKKNHEYFFIGLPFKKKFQFFIIKILIKIKLLR